MKKCPYCGKANEDAALVCSRCAAAFPAIQPETPKPEKQAEKKQDKE